MRKTRSHDPDVACYEHPSWLTMLLMRPLGLALMGYFGYGLFQIISAIAAGKGNSKMIPAVLACTAYFTIGTALAFYRRGVRIDRKKRIFTEWWGLLFPLKRKQTSIASIKYVSLAPASYYGIFITMQRDDSAVISESLFRETAARRLAKEIAQFLNCDFFDMAAPIWDVYSRGAISRPLGETFHAKRRLQKPPQEQWPTRLLLSSSNGSVTIRDSAFVNGFSLEANPDRVRMTVHLFGVIPMRYVVPCKEIYGLAEVTRKDTKALSLKIVAEHDTITFGRFEQIELTWVKFALMKAMAAEA